MRQLFKTLAVVILASMLAGCNSTKRVIYNFKNEEAIKTVLADGQIRI